MEINNPISAMQDFIEHMRAHDTRSLGHKATPQKRERKRRGYTKPLHDEKHAKMRRKMAAKSQRINRKK